MIKDMAESHNLWGSGGYVMNNPGGWTPSVLPSASSVQRYEQPRAAKRQMSESDDCEDVFSEESNSKDRCSSPSDDCQMGFSRKKRRGIIEKRRRDRINSSLTELRRLVPTAFEKQGSAKLEKAEILQMTVDHLKAIHSKGLDSLSYETQRVALDYSNLGFRECMSEVARYLSHHENLDSQDQLRIRLMSHLQCVSTQKELASKQASTPWNYNSYPNSYSIHDYPTPNIYDVSPSQHHQSLAGHHLPTVTPPSTSHLHQPLANRPSDGLLQPDGRSASQSSEPEQRHHENLDHGDSSRQIQTGLQPNYQTHQSYPPGYAQQGYNPSGQVKPYRPWGGEIASY